MLNLSSSNSVIGASSKLIDDFCLEVMIVYVNVLYSSLSLLFAFDLSIILHTHVVKNVKFNRENVEFRYVL